MVNLLTKLTTNGNIDMLRLDAVTFRTVMNENIVLITAAFQVLVGKNIGLLWGQNYFNENCHSEYQPLPFRVATSASQRATRKGNGWYEEW